jgi:23S rRNA pseudouridine2604 synthase
MSFRQKIKYYLVHNLNMSSKTANALISSGELKCNNIPVYENIRINLEDEWIWNGKIIKAPIILRYYLLFKPAGIECTLNPTINDSLFNMLQNLKIEGVHPVGRLDKDSEGLLFLTNDGRVMNKTIWKHNKIEKEYLVWFEEEVDSMFLKSMREGINLSGEIVKVNSIVKNEKKCVRIILTEGKNRQIRRMCYKCGKTVKRLLRVRWHSFEIQELKTGQFRELLKDELKEINKILF